MADILTNPEKPWDWYNLSENPGITVAGVTANPYKEWDWRGLSNNKFGYNATMQYYVGRRDQTIAQMKVFGEELIMVTWHPKGAMFKYYLEEHGMDLLDDTDVKPNIFK